MAMGATTQDYNSGKAAIGTGAFKLAKFTPGDRIEFARNDSLLGQEAQWEKSTFRLIRRARRALLLCSLATST